VLYAEDLRPPGYGTDKPLFKWTDKADLALDTDTTLVVDDGNDDITFLHLSRYMRHNLKRAQVPEGLVSTYESILVEFIDKWMDDPELLDTCFLELQVGSNRFERYVIHAMARYYGFYSFSKGLVISR
jgi:hypothetical protein